MNMNKDWTRTLAQAIVLGAVLAAVPMLGMDKPTNSPAEHAGETDAYLAAGVRHQLLLLPYYSIFDNLEYRMEGGRVELFGQVTRPILKSDAENVVKRVEGVEGVTNNIQVLPLSPNDDRIRLAEYRALFGRGTLYRYALGANPSIHIIVENGNVTLAGVVSSEMDRNIAGIEANGVPGVFSVTNNLRVES